MNGSLPPISRFTRAIRSMQAAATFFPVSTEPVKATPSMPSCEEIAPPTSPAPATMFTVPAGKWSKTPAIARVESGVTSDGLHTAEFPAARAGASFQVKSKQWVVPRDDAADHAERRP